MPEYQVDLYTPKDLDTTFNPRLWEALSLVRSGIFELRNISGVEATKSECDKYNGPAFREFWERVMGMDREPFLLASLTPNGGIVGVLEGRKYTYSGTRDRAIFVNWIVVDRKFRGKGVGSSIYKRVKEMARADDIKLLIAGINGKNANSRSLHLKEGFRLESPAEELSTGERIMLPFRTARGAYIPGYEVHDLDYMGNQVNRFIDVYTLLLK
jgi:L-amino acid N-acyltransferase YncA